MKRIKPFKKRNVANYKTHIDADGRVCTTCGQYKSWNEFCYARKQSVKIQKSAQCKVCKLAHRKAVGRNYTKEKLTNKQHIAALKRNDPFLYKARMLRSALLGRVKESALKLSTPTTEVLYNWFIKGPLICYYSGVTLLPFDKKSALKLTVDHKIPIVRGGTNELDNLCFASHHMNTAKGQLTDQEFFQLLALISRWEDQGSKLLNRLKQGHF